MQLKEDSKRKTIIILGKLETEKNYEELELTVLKLFNETMN